MPHLRVEGKGDKVRYLPLHVLAQRLIAAYLEAAGHTSELHGPLFRPVKNNRTRTLAKPLHPASVYHNVVRRYARELGLTDAIPGLCVHSLRATAATSALQHEADIAKVQEWLLSVYQASRPLTECRRCRGQAMRRSPHVPGVSGR